jgi:peptidoglycan/LPS O-acetylase OafA/YrhL
LKKPVWLGVAVFCGLGLYAHTLSFSTPITLTIGLTVIPIVFAGLLLKCFIPGSWERRFFSLRFMRFLGRYSYGIYVYHVLFWSIMIDRLHWLQAHLHSRLIAGFVYLLLWCACSLLLAVVSYKYFESPFLRLKERFASSKEPPARLLAEQPIG